MSLGQSFTRSYHVRLPFLHSLICAKNEYTRTYVLCQGFNGTENPLHCGGFSRSYRYDTVPIAINRTT